MSRQHPYREALSSRERRMDGGVRGLRVPGSARAIHPHPDTRENTARCSGRSSAPEGTHAAQERTNFHSSWPRTSSAMPGSTGSARSPSRASGTPPPCASSPLSSSSLQSSWSASWEACPWRRPEKRPWWAGIRPSTSATWVVQGGWAAGCSAPPSSPRRLKGCTRGRERFAALSTSPSSTRTTASPNRKRAPCHPASSPLSSGT